MADLKLAFNTQIVTASTKRPIHIQYQFQCIYCQSINVVALINDGGSVQMCNACGRTYRAKQVCCQ